DVNTKNQVDQSEEEDIEDEAIVQEVIDAVGKGGYRNIKDILQYLVPDLIQKGILNPHQPTINLRISGDGRNVGRKVKHVMVAVAILDDKSTLHKPNHYHTTILYPGCENYDSLSNVMAPFCHDLRNLKEQGLVINNIKWNFQLYFSSDWKFLATCLGFNGAYNEMKKIKINFQFWQDQGSKAWNYTSLMEDDKLKKWGLKAFSCSGIEKKNHEQVSYFFRKTMKDGGGGKKKSQSLAIVEILQHENRNLFYNHNNIPLSYQNPKKNHIKT
ncbi:hypothetical protein RhiirC2_716492, partial [Rhizophagus irregularis]